MLVQQRAEIQSQLDAKYGDLNGLDDRSLKSDLEKNKAGGHA